MSLRTYPRGTFTLRTVDGCGDPGCDNVEPGSRVTHPLWGGFGMVVSITSDGTTVLWTRDPHVTVTFPNVQRAAQQPIAASIIKVQPMTAPVGNVFYLDYTYGMPTTRWGKFKAWATANFFVVLALLTVGGWGLGWLGLLGKRH